MLVMFFSVGSVLTLLDRLTDVTSTGFSREINGYFIGLSSPLRQQSIPFPSFNTPCNSVCVSYWISRAWLIHGAINDIIMTALLKIFFM